MDFLNRGRWFFDPARGLMRSCKNPQQDDSALKKYWTKDRLQLDHRDAGGDGNGDTADVSVNVEEPVKAKSSKAAKKAAKKADKKGCSKTASKTNIKTDAKADGKAATTKRGRKPIVIQSSDEEDEDISVMEVLLSPKKTRKTDRGSEWVTPLVTDDLIGNIQSTVPIETPVPPSAGTDLKMAAPVNHTTAQTPVTLPASLPAGTMSGMMQFMMSFAYDNAALTAKKYDLERREKEIDRKQRFLDEQAEKASFMAGAADAFKHHFSCP